MLGEVGQDRPSLPFEFAQTANSEMTLLITLDLHRRPHDTAKDNKIFPSPPPAPSRATMAYGPSCAPAAKLTASPGN